MMNMCEVALYRLFHTSRIMYTNNHKIKNRTSDATVSACKVLTVNRRL